MSITRFAVSTFAAAALIGAGMGVAEAAAPADVPAAVAIDDTTTTPVTPPTGSAGAVNNLLKALTSGSAQAGGTGGTTTGTNG